MFVIKPGTGLAILSWSEELVRGSIYKLTRSVYNCAREYVQTCDADGAMDELDAMGRSQDPENGARGDW